MLHNTSRFTIVSAAGLLALAGFATSPAAFATDSSQTAPCYRANACKGQGFKALSASECGKEHGSTTSK
jgi:hypothetical protein